MTYSQECPILHPQTFFRLKIPKVDVMRKFLNRCIRSAVLVVAVCAGCFFIPTARHPLLDSCDRSVEEFRETGKITCGHIMWDLHPHHAALLSGDPRPYLSKYDRLYRSFKTFLGREPTQQSIRMFEQCPNGSPTHSSECPNGALETNVGPMYVWRGADILSCFSALFRIVSPQFDPWKSHDPSYRTVYITSSFFKDVFPTLASDEQQPISASFIHEFGHVFMPYQEGDDAYIWDPVFLEDFASFFGALAVIIPNEIEKRGEKYYWDGWCLSRGKPSLCNDYFENLGQSSSIEYSSRWEKFLEQGPGKESIHRHFSDMLYTLYLEYAARGEIARYAEGFRKLFRFYHGMTAMPSHWKQNQEHLQPSLVVTQKVNVFVFLLSVYMREDVSDRFRVWGYPITDKTTQSIKTLSASNYAESMIPYYVSFLATDGLSLKNGSFPLERAPFPSRSF